MGAERGISMSGLRVCGILLITAAFVSAWDHTDTVFDDSMDDEATVATLSINEEGKYKKSLNTAQQLDDTLTDDSVKDDSGEELEHEIGGAMATLRHSKMMDQEAEQRRHQQEAFDSAGLGESLLPPNKPKAAPAAKLDHAFDDYTATQKLYEDDDAVELGESFHD